MNNPWNNLQVIQPKDGILVDTKVDDGHGIRNEQPLIKKGNLWWDKEETMQVYYTPTHWKLKK